MKKHLFSTFSLFFISLLSLVTAGFSSWIAINPDTSKSFKLDTTENTVVCYNSSTKVNYTSLKTALDNASDNQEIVLYIGATAVCDKDITIKKNVTLTIPFVGKAFDTSKTANNISDSTLYMIPDVDSRNNYGNKLGDSSKDTVSTYRSCLLQMKNGADIINYGTLNLGGACSTNGNNGYYSEINLGLASSIQCKSESTFNCYGYIKENPEDYSNPTNQEKEVFDNSLDKDRYIEVENGAKMATALAMYDAPTAGSLTMLISANQCPFWEWDFPNLQTYTKIDAGSAVSAYALLIGPSGMGINKEVTLFSSNTGSQSMFYVTSGYLGIEYVTKDPLYSSRDFNTRHTNMFFAGNTHIGYIYAKEGSGKFSVELDTRKSFLPVSCRMKMIVGSGATLTTDKKIKFLAGSELLIQENGKFLINNEIIFHKKDSITLNSGTGIYYRSKGKDDVDDSHLICNGTIQFNSDNNKNGSIGAFVEHKNSNGTAVFDLSSMSDESKLSVKDVEGSSDVTVLITSTGEFEQGIARFLKGNSYSSGFSDSKYYWNGVSVSTYDVNITVLEGTENSVALYTLQYADDANGTNLKDSDLLDSKTSGVASIPNGKYAKLVLTRGQSAVIKDTLGNVITSDYSSYFLVDKNYSIDIVPSETYTIDFTIEKDSDKVQWNGTGHFTFEIWESKSKDGTFSKVFDGKYNDKGKYVCKDSYFYIKRPFDNDLLYNYFKNENAEITKTPDVGDKPKWNVKSKEQSPTYFADADYAFKTKWTYTGGCFASGTPILMCDGTYKNIEELTYTDKIMTWNFFEGKYETQSIAILVDHGEEEYEVTDLVFSDNSKLSIIADHGLFDYDLNQFVYLTSNNCNEYIGHIFAKDNAGKTEFVRLLSTRTYSKVTHAYSLTSTFNYNAVANGILTSPPPGEFYNWVSMAGKMKYDLVKFNADVEKYGLYDYSIFEPYGISYETFVAFNGQYLKIPVEKGIFSFEYIIELFDTYKGWFEG